MDMGQAHSSSGGHSQKYFPCAGYCVNDPFSSFGEAVVCMLLGMAMITVIAMKLLTQMSPGTNGTDVVRASSNNILALDGMRTLLCTYVLIHNYSFDVGVYPDNGLKMPDLVVNAVAAGHIAVSAFFVLSGFVTYLAECEKQSYFDYSAASVFVGRRLARLCPAYFAALLWLSVLAANGLWVQQPFAAWPMQSVFAATLFPVHICNPPGSQKRALVSYQEGVDLWVPWQANWAGWFVCDLVVISCLFPLFYNRRPRSGLPATCCAFALLIAIRCVATMLSKRHEGDHFYIFIPTRTLEFGAGMLAAQWSIAAPLHVVSWSGWGLVMDFTFAVLVAPTVTLLSSDVKDYFVTGVCAIMCIAARCQHAQAQQHSGQFFGAGITGRFLSSWPLVKLSAFSYGAYILAIPTKQIIPHTELPVDLWWVTPVVAWLVAATWSTQVETPLMRRVLKG